MFEWWVGGKPIETIGLRTNPAIINEFIAILRILTSDAANKTSQSRTARKNRLSACQDIMDDEKKSDFGVSGSKVVGQKCVYAVEELVR